MLTLLTGGTMDTKELILLVAKEEFIKKGYDDTSLRDIAKKCHISPTAIYRHFENKEDIFNEIIRPLFNYFDEATNYIQSTDYKFLKENKPSNVWDFEREGNYYFKFLFGPYTDLVKLLVKERKSWFKKYIVDFEYDVTIKYLNEMKKNGHNINNFNNISFKLLLDSYLEAYINLLDLNLNEDTLKEVCKEINNFYTIGFRNLLGF